MPMTLRVCVTLLLLSYSCLAEADQHKLAASSIASPYHAAGVALEAATSIYLMPETGIKLTSVSTKGVLDNVERLSRGDVDFAIIPSLLGFQARLGTGMMSGTGPQHDLRAVAMMVPSVVHAVLRKSLAQSGALDDLLKLQREKLQLGSSASEAESIARFLFQQLGAGSDNLDGRLADKPQPVPAFLDGEVDALLTTGSLPNADVRELFEGLQNDALILNITDDQLRQVNNGFDLITPATIPAETYVNQSDAIRTLALPVFLATRADVDDDVVYQIAKIMFEQVGFLRTIQPAMEALDFETAIDNLPVPLHPGAARYYEDYGLSVAGATTSIPEYPVYELSADDPAKRRIDANSGVVGIMVDPDSTSLQAASELAVVVNSAQSDVRVVVQRGEGSAATVNDLLYLKGVDLGIVQADVLENLRGREDKDWLPGQLRYLPKLYDSEVHLLVRNDIERIRDLAGKTVNFGPHGSASEVAAATIFSQLGLAVARSSDPSVFALEKLKRGDIDAVVLSGGKPMPSLASIEPGQGIKLLDVPNMGYSDVYQTTSITSDDYPNLIEAADVVRSVSVPAMLMAYKRPENSDRHQLLTAFFRTFEAHLGQLKAPDRFHPTWQEVSLTADFEGWTRSSVATDIIARAGGQTDAKPSLPAPPASPLPLPDDTDSQASRKQPANGPS